MTIQKEDGLTNEPINAIFYATDVKFETQFLLAPFRDLLYVILVIHISLKLMLAGQVTITSLASPMPVSSQNEKGEEK